MEEKGSDVNRAAHLLNDAWQSLFEASVVVSNDTDLVTPIRMVTRERKWPVFVLCSGRWQIAHRCAKRRAVFVTSVRTRSGRPSFRTRCPARRFQNPRADDWPDQYRGAEVLEKAGGHSGEGRGRPGHGGRGSSREVPVPEHSDTVAEGRSGSSLSQIATAERVEARSLPWRFRIVRQGEASCDAVSTLLTRTPRGLRFGLGPADGEACRGMPGPWALFNSRRPCRQSFGN